MKHKGRTIGIIILCAVVVLLAINWQVQPLHSCLARPGQPPSLHAAPPPFSRFRKPYARRRKNLQVPPPGRIQWPWR